MSALPPRYELLSPDGGVESPPYAAVLQDESPRFLSCAALAGVRMTLPVEAEVASLRALFVPGGRSDSLNSWVRDLLLPPAGALQIEGPEPLDTQERRFAVGGEGTPGPAAVLIELRFSPRRLSQLTLRLPAGPFGLMHLSAHGAPYEGEPWDEAPVADLPRYPPSQADLPRRGDLLAAQLLSAGGEEPSLAVLWERALPYRGGALIGTVEGPLAQVSWDGGIVVRHPHGESDRLWLRLDLGPLAALSAPAEQGLLDGWLPVSVVRSAAGGWRLQQTALVDLRGCLRVRWELESDGSGAGAITPRLRAAVSRLLQAEGGAAARRVAHEAVTTRLPRDPAGGPCAIGPLAGTLQPAPAQILAGQHVALELALPLAGRGPEGSFDEALAELRDHWTAYLDAGAQLSLPDPLLQDLWRALSVHNRLFVRDGRMRYGLFPGVYEDAIFGVEEGWNLVAMAQYGQGRLAEEVLRRTFFDPEFLKKEGQHHQYRNGLAPTYALDVFRLTGARDWLRKLYPTVLESAAWIEESLRSTQVLEEGGRPVWYGLMPKHTYGGDLKDPAYSLYGSSACWRGLRDSSLISEILSDHAAAARFAAAAEEARRNMREAARRICQRRGDRAPFLPFRTDEPGEEPSAGDYHQLFASLVLETALLGWDDPCARGIVDYLEETGRLAAGVARFDQWFGRLGIDAEYSRGVQLAHMVRRRFDRFWLGLVGQVGLSCDPCTFVSPETAIVRFSRQDYQDRMRTLAQNPRRFDSDPCSAGTAVMLQYLRYLLCFEERDEADLPTGALWLGPAAPPSWFRPGVSFGASALPTCFGPISFRCSSDDRGSTYEIQTSQKIEIEVFAVGADGRRRSVRGAACGAARVELPRCYA